MRKILNDLDSTRFVTILISNQFMSICFICQNILERSVPIWGHSIFCRERSPSVASDEKTESVPYFSLTHRYFVINFVSHHYFVHFPNVLSKFFSFLNIIVVSSDRSLKEKSSVYFASVYFFLFISNLDCSVRMH